MNQIDNSACDEKILPAQDVSEVFKNFFQKAGFKEIKTEILPSQNHFLGNKTPCFRILTQFGTFKITIFRNFFGNDVIEIDWCDVRIGTNSVINFEALFPEEEVKCEDAVHFAELSKTGKYLSLIYNRLNYN